jgi:hypothetical protein
MLGERTFSELLADLSVNLRTLFRQEIALARAEMTHSVVSARRGATLIAAGVAMAAAGGLAIVACLCLALVALGLSPVAATFVVGAVLVVGGLFFVRFGRASLAPDHVTPRATVEALRDNAQLLRGQTR